MRLKTPKARNGLKQFIENLLPDNPLLIVSAGISDVILKTLAIHDIDTSHCNLYISANYLKFDVDGSISSILPEVPIHSKSKHLSPQQLPHLFFSNVHSHVRQGQQYLHWDAVVLFGDRPGDFNYLKDHSEVTKLKIGFSRTFSDAKQLAAESGCHAILVGEDHSFEPVNHLIQLLNDSRQQGMQQLPKKETQKPCDSFYFFQTESVFLNENFMSSMTIFLDHLASKPCNLLFISDFDHTITTFSSEQCHDLIGNVSEYSSDFRAKYQEFMVEYGPSNVYGEFHTLCHNLLSAESGLTREMFQKSFTSSNVPKVRPGWKQFLELLNEHRLPLLISSAGIKDIIVTTLEMHDINVSQCELLNIDANYLQFDSCSGKLIAVLPLEPIHSQSKHLVTERMAEFFYAPQNVPASAPIIPADSYGANILPSDDSHNNSNASSKGSSMQMQYGVALVLGDSPGDFTVLQDHPEVTTLKVGFSRDHDAAATLMEHAGCHVVFIGESHSWEPVNGLLDLLLDAQRRGH